MTPAGDPLVLQRHIQASPETVFGFFTDPRRWLHWQAWRPNSTHARAAWSA